MNRRKVFDFCIPEQMDVKDDKKTKMKGRTKRCKKKRRKVGQRRWRHKFLKSAASWKMLKTVSEELPYLVCFLKKHPGYRVMEGCRLPQKPMELKRTFPFFYIFDLDLKCTLKSPFNLIKNGTSINCTVSESVVPVDGQLFLPLSKPLPCLL